MGMFLILMFGIPVFLPVVTADTDAVIAAGCLAVGRTAVLTKTAVRAGRPRCSSKTVAALDTFLRVIMAGAPALVTRIAPVIPLTVPAPATPGTQLCAAVFAGTAAIVTVLPSMVVIRTVHTHPTDVTFHNIDIVRSFTFRTMQALINGTCHAQTAVVTHGQAFTYSAPLTIRAF